MKIKFFLFIALFQGFICAASAQSYFDTGIGLRAGTSSGLTVKHFLNETAALEGILASRWRGFTITGLYEVHRMAFDTDRLNYYFGGGAHIGFYNEEGYARRIDRDKYRNSYAVIGLDGILGLEYTFEEVPINLSLDWKPAFDLAPDAWFWADELAISVRFVF